MNAKLGNGIIAVLFGSFVSIFGSTNVFAANCALQYAPGKFAYNATKDVHTANLADRGIVPSGFVLLADKTPTAQGIDASKYQGTVDFEQVKICGGDFAYIRLSAGNNAENELEYRALWANSRSVGLLTGPYHNFDLHEVHQPFSKLSAQLQDDTRSKAIAEAGEQAELFKTRLQEVLNLDPKESGTSPYLGNPYLPIALDLSWRPQATFSAADQEAYGTVYRAAICSFIDNIKKDSRFKDQPIVIFTTPSLYHDFQLKKSSCGLDTAPVWLSYHSKDGDRPHPGSKGIGDDELSELCGIDKNTRCSFQQYTSFGGFALFQVKSGLDMDRFFGTVDDLRQIEVRAKKTGS